MIFDLVCMLKYCMLERDRGKVVIIAVWGQFLANGVLTTDSRSINIAH